MNKAGYYPHGWRLLFCSQSQMKQMIVARGGAQRIIKRLPRTKTSNGMRSTEERNLGRYIPQNMLQTFGGMFKKIELVVVLTLSIRRSDFRESRTRASNSVPRLSAV